MSTIHGAGAHSTCRVPLYSHHSNPSNARTSMQGGQAVFENDNYRIAAGGNNSVLVNDKRSGEGYRVHGDPHMDIDGRHAFDFWGTTTLKLEDGTKLTIETTPVHNGTTLASKVTIINGDYGVRISGIDTHRAGDLKIDEAKGWGRVLDAMVNDGNVLHENPAGPGFLAVDGCGTLRAVDQEFVNQTDLQRGGGEALQNQFKDVFRGLGGLLSIAFKGGFLGEPERAAGPSRPAAPLVVRPTDPNRFDPAMAALNQAVCTDPKEYSSLKFREHMMTAAGGDAVTMNELVNAYSHTVHCDRTRVLSDLAHAQQKGNPAAYGAALASYANAYGLSTEQARQQVRTYQETFNRCLPRGSYNERRPETNKNRQPFFTHL